MNHNQDDIACRLICSEDAIKHIAFNFCFVDGASSNRSPLFAANLPEFDEMLKENGWSLIAYYRAFKHVIYGGTRLIADAVTAKLRRQGYELPDE